LVQEFQISATTVETVNRSSGDDAGPDTPLLERIGGGRVLLATHAWQMRRASDRLRSQGLAVLEAPTVVTRPLHDAGNPKQWMPRFWALGLSKRSMQERLDDAWHRLTSLLG
jgi:uncharacterized SAM-binding protein YcdF (DUF218 family)